MITRRTFSMAALASAATGCSPVLSYVPPPVGALNRLVPVDVSPARVRLSLGWKGHAAVPVAFDTGTSGNALDLEFWRGTGLARTGEAQVTDGGTGLPIEAFETTLPEANFSGCPVGDMLASVYDYHPRDEVGIVGPNVFWGQLVYLELGMRRLRIRDLTADAIPTWPAYPYHDYGVPNSTPALTVKLPNGESVIGTLDSGANAQLLLPMRFRDSLVKQERGAGNQVSAGSTTQIIKAKLEGVVEVGPVTLQDPDVIFFPGVHASIGMPILGRLRVLLDPAGHRWWALAPRVLSESDSARFIGRYGPLNVMASDQSLSVTGDEQLHRVTWLGASLFVSDRGDDWSDAFGGARTLFDFNQRDDGKIVEVIRTSGTIDVHAKL